MKAIFVSAIISIFLSCSGNKIKDEKDPTNVVVPSNSDATNPSLADTAYHRNDSVINKDSTQLKH